MYKETQAVLPVNSVDLEVPFMSSSPVHLALRAVADAPEESDEHHQDAEHEREVGEDDPHSVPVLLGLLGHQVDPEADRGLTVKSLDSGVRRCPGGRELRDTIKGFT
ncbi:hypothetical protein EYF80_031769 [Liparis tanakae]|uniref:Uncharacterized protein n=1 Tax=Liparis tanakae TaxID=230148 RepID=A0A4Z2GXI4_9TELE|nr:hypothetical protein EYF80_031769 [Liparis tanakae]